MKTENKVMVIGAGGRVGLALVGALAGRGMAICAVDRLAQTALESRVNRVVIDAALSSNFPPATPAVIGDIDVLNIEQLTTLIAQESPEVVVNYAIPFTWDAARNLPNYPAISSAGLGAFAPTQLLAPRAIGQAITASGVPAKFVVGNLPDITVPVLHGMAKTQAIAKPVGGAGNVGLIAQALTSCIANDLKLSRRSIQVSLVAHHVHWVAPREPGYPNDAPFLLEVRCNGGDITDQLGDTRDYMNRAINRCYEPGAGFSSTTGLLAAELVYSLVADTEKTVGLHMPAPNGLPGGYPVTISGGDITVALPAGWEMPDAVAAMHQAHRRDGIEKIGEDGSVQFNAESVAIMQKELGIALPEIVRPDDLDDVAREQIKRAIAAVA